MQRLLLIAFAIGAFISGALLGIEHLTGDTAALLSWQLPGVSAAFLFWGAVGGSASAGIIVAWFVNALVYGAVALVILWVLRPLLHPK